MGKQVLLLFLSLLLGGCFSDNSRPNPFLSGIEACKNDLIDGMPCKRFCECASELCLPKNYFEGKLDEDNFCVATNQIWYVNNQVDGSGSKEAPFKTIQQALEKNKNSSAIVRPYILVEAAPMAYDLDDKMPPYDDLTYTVAIIGPWADPSLMGLENPSWGEWKKGDSNSSALLKSIRIYSPLANIVIDGFNTLKGQNSSAIDCGKINSLTLRRLKISDHHIGISVHNGCKQLNLFRTSLIGDDIGLAIAMDLAGNDSVSVTVSNSLFINNSDTAIDVRGYGDPQTPQTSVPHINLSLQLSTLAQNGQNPIYHTGIDGAGIDCSQTSNLNFSLSEIGTLISNNSPMAASVPKFINCTPTIMVSKFVSIFHSQQADPDLKTPWLSGTLAGSTFLPSDFRITEMSPELIRNQIEQGSSFAAPTDATQDFFGNKRGEKADIGFHDSQF